MVCCDVPGELGLRAGCRRAFGCSESGFEGHEVVSLHIYVIVSAGESV